MNERIQELAEQAGYTPLPGFDFANSLQEVFIKNFAELIVRECMDIVEHSRIEGDEGVCLVGATKCKIEQHFGVE
jgi:hypothetical protein